MLFEIKIRKKRKIPCVGIMGWAVNSIAKAIEGSIPSLPIKQYQLHIAFIAQR